MSLAWEVESLFQKVAYTPKQTSQASWDAWDLRRLWTFLWRRQKDAAVREQTPKDICLAASIVVV